MIQSFCGCGGFLGIGDGWHCLCIMKKWPLTQIYINTVRDCQKIEQQGVTTSIYVCICMCLYPDSNTLASCTIPRRTETRIPLKDNTALPVLLERLKNPDSAQTQNHDRSIDDCLFPTQKQRARKNKCGIKIKPHSKSLDGSLKPTPMVLMAHRNGNDKMGF
jgi:hypothetical protein